jgi:hypothetical protein
MVVFFFENLYFNRGNYLFFIIIQSKLKDKKKNVKASSNRRIIKQIKF